MFFIGNSYVTYKSKNSTKNLTQNSKEIASGVESIKKLESKDVIEIEKNK